ncbi:MAG: hypothetical protein ACYC8T_17695 [Myxococcaceae bacterium]
MSHLTRALVLSFLVLFARAGLAQAAECETPPRRDPTALRESAQQDEMLALALDKALQACSAAGTGESCSKARAGCTELARATVERGSRHEEGVFLADLQRTLNGQRYVFADPGPVPAHGLVSCETGAADLGAAADSRRKASAHHQRVASEYEAYLKWSAGAFESCKDQLRLTAANDESSRRIEAERQQRERLAQAAVAAENARLAQAAAAAKAQAARLEEARRAEEERKKVAALMAERAERERQQKLAEAAKRAEEQRQREAEEREERAEKEREAQAAAKRAQEEKQRQAAEAAEAAREAEKDRLERQAQAQREQVEKARQEAEERAEKQREQAIEAAEREEMLKKEKEEQARELARRQEAEAKTEREREARKAEEAMRRQAEAKALAERTARIEDAKRQQQALRAQEEARRAAAEKDLKAREAAEVARREQVRRDLEAARTAGLARLEAQRRALEEEDKKRAQDKEARRRSEDAQEVTDRQRREEALAKAAAEHQKQIEQLEHSASAVDEKKSEESEKALDAAAQAEADRRAAADKQIAAAGFVDPKSRSGGALQAMGAVGLAVVTGVTPPNGSSTLAGVTVNLRKGFWLDPPLEGMQKGFELRATGRFLTEVSGSASVQLIQAAPEARVWLGRFAIGFAADYRRLQSRVGLDENFSTGPSLALALLDDQAGRCIVGARWLPLMGGTLMQGAADIEASYEWFTASFEAGFLTPGGWYASGSLGFRLRF